MFEKVTTVEAIEVMKDQTVAVRYLIKITEDRCEDLICLPF